MLHKHYMEHAITDHCNLKCDGCSMHSPYLDSAFSEIESFKKDIAEVAKYICFTEFRFVGGEPTLHPNIIEFFKETKKSGITKRIAVCTNGSSIFTLTPEFFLAVDLIYISMYPETGINYNKITQYLDSITDKYNFNYIYENKDTTFIKMHSDVELSLEETQKNFMKCQIAWDWGCISFKDGRLFRCSISLIKNKFFKQTGQSEPYDFLQEDSIPIYDSEFNEQNLNMFIYSRESLKACRFCFGTRSISVPRKQLTTQEIKFVKERYAE